MPAAKQPSSEPRNRDAERTQHAILLAGRDEFAEHGLSGARVDRIAERANVNKQLIYYYFKSKDELFQKVLEMAYENIRQAEKRLHLQDLPPSEAIRRLTAFTWDYYIAHPEFIALLNSENLHQGRHLSGSERMQKMNTPLIATLADILERGRREGTFREGLDALQLYVTLAGMAYFYLSNRHTLAAVFGRDLMLPGARDERLAHMCEVALAYVQAR